MSEGNPSVKKDEKIEKILELIKFEIQNATTQLSLYKKDNVNLILLLLALIGFFAFIPLDIFTYKWFENAILLILIISSVAIYFRTKFWYDSWKDTKNKIKNDTDEPSCKDCGSCVDLILCKNLDDPKKRIQIKQFLDSKRIDLLYLIDSANNYCSFAFLLTAILAYWYCSGSFFGNQRASLFNADPVIGFLLFLLFISFLARNYQMKRLKSKKNFQSMHVQSFIIACIICSLSILIEIYGNLLKIPPFIEITNSTQLSVTLFEHSNNIPSLSLTLVIGLYSIILLIVMMEYFFTVTFVEKINQKLLDLLELKSIIDLYQIGIISEIDTNQILKKFSKLIIIVPRIQTLYGVISIPIPLDLNNYEEIITLALGDSETENHSK